MLIFIGGESSSSIYKVIINGPVKVNLKLEKNDTPKLLEYNPGENIIDAEYTESKNINYKTAKAIKSYTALEDKREQKTWSTYT